MMDKFLRNKSGFPKVDDPMLPGTRSQDIGKVIYVLLQDHADSYDAFDELFLSVSPPIGTHGAVLVEDWLVRTPPGEIFYPLFFHGDVEGWRRQIELGAKQLGLKSARIEDDDFLVSGGPEFPLSECVITLGGSPFSLPGH